jgi:hypothetical protein
MKILKIMVVVVLMGSGVAAMAMGGEGDRARGRATQISLQAKQQLQDQLNKEFDRMKNRLDTNEVELAEVNTMLKTVRAVGPHATGEALRKATALENRLTDLQIALTPS